ncbi:MAG TPA: Lrp/AsnC ligand binding domain-containing protein [Kaistella sp.]|jgi:Lrp/AsnC family transcriptional regulator for asnA, asnC and gidA|uniref:Lrp/AsnC ligand binding domain-containing protein n=1 Tax=Candidatus Kaistella beijingensis TaxID=2820270 RepID=UPI000EF0C7BC|nr:Lrp/AsnC ligand binding domain-containing protein [Candidatus Kaistella beijingensis]HCN10880.1 transcriptional regulator [Chryseobacterium sp.]HMU07073.1 Lrp/AsnC ligand binding domain-containing protein [Kaistella sp.]UBB90863.1 Lrp/AsnC ligand binding domain-containing protein [Candidatus Kaistella beijingensis]HOB24661.1 Lrp/AsnC ligand binding domain-containing protein [Kaistella sp.]HPZ24859.1 Lrp/AsnC ligand binding domain-containing protein [Kaistella sp.]
MKNAANTGYHLDSVDKEIIYMLMDNAKTSLAHISKNVGISTTAVHQRIKKLESAGVIENSISFLNPRKIGFKVVSYIGVFLDQPSHYHDAIKALKDVNEVVEAHYTTGNYTIFLKVLCRDNDHLMEILNKLQKLKGVTRTETFISLEQSINRQLKV